MVDIIIKPSDPRPHRWWGKPSPTQEYRDNYDRIFGKNQNKKATKKRAKRSAKKAGK